MVTSVRFMMSYISKYMSVMSPGFLSFLLCSRISSSASEQLRHIFPPPKRSDSFSSTKLPASAAPPPETTCRRLSPTIGTTRLSSTAFISSSQFLEFITSALIVPSFAFQDRGSGFSFPQPSTIISIAGIAALRYSSYGFAPLSTESRWA